MSSTIKEYVKWRKRLKSAIQEEDSIWDDACCSDRLEDLLEKMTPEEKTKIGL